MGTESGLRRRVKGLSEAEFRAALRHRGGMPGGAVSAALGQGLGLPGLRPRALRRAQGPGGLPVQPLQAPGRADRRHRVPLDQAAADHVVSGDLPSDPEQGRDELGRAGAPARHAPADRLADQAQADGGDGSSATPASPSSRAGSRSTTPIWAVRARAASAGRGAAGKTPFVAAVETTAERKPRRLRLTVVKGFRKKEIATLAKRDFAAGSNVVSDGLSCWTAVEAAGCTHFPMTTGSGPQAAKLGALHLGQHRAGQHQDGARRHLPSRQRRSTRSATSPASPGASYRRLPAGRPVPGASGAMPVRRLDRATGAVASGHSPPLAA